MILKILSTKYKSFLSEEGEKIDYYWCKVETPEGYVKQLGTPNDYESKIGEKLEIPVEVKEGKSGEWLKEVKLD